MQTFWFVPDGRVWVVEYDHVDEEGGMPLQAGAAPPVERMAGPNGACGALHVMHECVLSTYCTTMLRPFRGLFTCAPQS